MSRVTLSLRTGAVAAVVCVCLSLGGCFLLPPLPGPFGGGGGNGGGSSDTTSGDNGIPLVNQQVPANFPSEVPLPDLDILMSLSVADGSWAITYKANDMLADYDAAVAAYEAAGWEVQTNNRNADGSLAVFSNEPYAVQLFGLPDGGNDYDGPVLSFTVVRTQ